MLESVVALETPSTPTSATNTQEPVTGLPVRLTDEGAVVRSSQQRYLFAFAPQAEVVQFLRMLATDADAAGRGDVLARWTDLQPRVAALVAREAGFADRARIEAVPEELRQTVEAFTTDALFQQSFSAMPTEVGIIDIDTVVAGQRIVNLEHVDAIKKSLPTHPTIADCVTLCISPRRRAEAVRHLEQGGAHVFSAPNMDFRFLGAFLKPVTPDDLQYALGGGCPAMAIIAFVGFGSAPVNAFVLGSRVILNNGFHRLYALRALGVKMAPVVLQRPRNPLVEMPPVIAGAVREYLATAPRPVMIKDFFEEGFAITLGIKERLKTVTLGWNVNQFDVPI